jgi:uncharacterized protein YjbI with pentapeptide repeats
MYMGNNMDILTGRDENPLTRVDVEQKLQMVGSSDLLDLSNQNLRAIDLGDFNLRGANLRGANLSGANLSGANLSGANLRGANLYNANLRGANLYNANLRGANPDVIILDTTKQSKLDLSNILSATLRGLDLSGADLSGADLSGANLRGANLYNANLRGANLYNASLRGANLNGANLSATKLDRGRLDLLNKILPGLDLSGADLSGANLRGANLRGANLSKANLSGANLNGANLSKANLSGANLNGANLSEANLSRLILELGSLSLKKGLKDILRNMGAIIEEPTKTTPERANFDAAIRIRIEEEPLTTRHLSATLDTFTSLYVKMWLLQQGRFNDFIQYTEHKDHRFEEEANLLIAELKYNSPVDIKLILDVKAIAEAFQTIFDTFTQARQRKQAKEEENRSKDLDNQLKEEAVKNARLDNVDHMLETTKRVAKMIEKLQPGLDEEKKIIALQSLMKDILPLAMDPALEISLLLPSTPHQYQNSQISIKEQENAEQTSKKPQIAEIP